MFFRSQSFEFAAIVHTGGPLVVENNGAKFYENCMAFSRNLRFSLKGREKKKRHDAREKLETEGSIFWLFGILQLLSSTEGSLDFGQKQSVLLALRAPLCFPALSDFSRIFFSFHKMFAASVVQFRKRAF